MARDWHSTFRQWAKPPSETEEEKASNVASMIRSAINGSTALNCRDVTVYATGSYRNNTNTRTESDVDVAVVLKDCFFHADLPVGLTREALGVSDSTQTFLGFRNDVHEALRAKFGRGVTRGPKAFDIHENSYRLDADVAVFFEHRRYTGNKNPDGSWHYYEGVEMRPEDAPAKRIINWHHQHYEHGVVKNAATGRRFKRIVRILKRLRTHLLANGSAAERLAAAPIASFLIESLVYNVPAEHFNQSTETYYDDAKKVIGWLWNRINEKACNDFKEVSEFKWLLRAGQPWDAEQAKNFLAVAWGHVGFGKD